MGPLEWTPKPGPNCGASSGSRAYSDVVCATPIYKDNLVFLSAIGGSDLVELSKNGDTFTAKRKATTREFQNMHGGVVLVGEYLYGANQHRNWQCPGIH